MFDFFRRRTAKDLIEEAKEKYAVPKNPNHNKEEKPSITYYRLGVTNDNRVSFQMGYSEITMNRAGVDNLIRQLAVFRDQLPEDEVCQAEE